MTERELLVATIARIETVGWVSHMSSGYGPLCIVQTTAMVDNACYFPTRNNLYHRLAGRLGLKGVVDLMNWNDAPGRTKEEVLTLLRETLASLSEGA